MSSRYSVAWVTTLLLAGVRGLGQNYNFTVSPNMTIASSSSSSSSDEVSAYGLIDEYNAGNWLSKFDVLQVSFIDLSLLTKAPIN